jgi:hypothetical protein
MAEVSDKEIMQGGHISRKQSKGEERMEVLWKTIKWVR